MKHKPGSNLLTPRQRGWIEGEARAAFRKLESAGATDETYNDWRVREAIKVCGFRISEAPKRAFDDLLSHFQSLNGKTDKAMDRLTGKENDWRFWESEIIKQLNRDHLPWNYAETICEKYHHGLRTHLVGPPEMKIVFINVRNAVDARLEKRAGMEQEAANAATKH